MTTSSAISSRRPTRRRSSSTSGSTAAARWPTITSNMLRRPLVSYWATRYGEPIRTPNAAILGPKVMIIDETAGSGGDLLPWMFRKFGLGKLVGKRTWGGLVGILGFPVLMDGGVRHGARTWRSSPRTAGSSRTWACRRTSRSSRTRPPWPRARTRSSTGPSRSSWRSWPRTRRRSRRPGRRSPSGPGRRGMPRRAR